MNLLLPGAETQQQKRLQLICVQLSKELMNMYYTQTHFINELIF